VTALTRRIPLSALGGYPLFIWSTYGRLLRRESGVLPIASTSYVRERGEDLGDLSSFSQTFPLRASVWELRDNFTAADAFFVALAERLEEPFATKNRRLGAVATTYTNIQIVELGSPGP